MLQLKRHSLWCFIQGAKFIFETQPPLSLKNGVIKPFWQLQVHGKQMPGSEVEQGEARRVKDWHGMVRFSEVK